MVLPLPAAARARAIATSAANCDRNRWKISQDIDFGKFNAAGLVALATRHKAVFLGAA